MCLYPNAVKRMINYETGEIYYQFLGQLNGMSDDDTIIPVPCCECVECLEQHSNEWAYRVMNELELYNGIGCMVTLTYADTDGELHKPDYQKFLKRLRKKYSDRKVRYFCCGEYGSQHQRPHFHIILFGVDFSEDRYFWKNSQKGFPVYRSDTLEKLWTQGFADISEISLYTAKYSAKYMQKLEHWSMFEHKQEPFTAMSTHPGLGYDSIDVEQILTTDKIYVNGTWTKSPRYYLKVIERNGLHPERLGDLRQRRKKKAALLAPDDKQLEMKRQRFREFKSKKV